MEFLIFGGTGFVGKNLERYLRKNNHKVISVSRSGGPEKLAVDITNEETFANIDSTPDVVVNCASVVPSKGRRTSDPAYLNDLFITNTTGGANIVNWARRKGVKKIINCSTLVVVKKPWPNPLIEQHSALPDGPHVGYSMSKLSQEQIMSECARNSMTDIIHLRLSAIYGAGMVSEGVIFDLMGAAKENEDIVLKDANRNFMDLLHVEDVCKGVERIAEKDFVGGTTIMNLASGNEISVLQLAEIIKKVTGSSSKIVNQDEKKHESRANIDTKKFLKFIGIPEFEFHNLAEGLEELVEFERSKNIFK